MSLSVSMLKETMICGLLSQGEEKMWVSKYFPFPLEPSNAPQVELPGPRDLLDCARESEDRWHSGIMQWMPR